ncbi:deoxyribose-phosphate aldolase [Oscillibacter sp.]|uniref:deoxyribose-phosphate aldolase n=1 Tax=Oscillibacter sp. TaxID=1945593 RepID=UPI00261B7693|nr:deoxyribose-phosphate aldolase [Oscillibacter sp.]MDD3347445.1 deoxyribose-phosphate aldolase [Oscillibacter sp.]
MKISRYFDHAVLKPNMTEQEVRDAIQLGIDYDVYSVCVRPCDIDLAVSMCKGTNTRVSCVLDFPHGDSTAEGKAALAEQYAAKGVAEIDMVMNFGYARSGKWDEVEAGIAGVVRAAKAHGVGVKVIFESCCLTVEEIKKATELCIHAGADFVKTSTGFAASGASVEAVAAMLEAAQGRIKVKPSGGIRDYETAKKYVDMGVHRLGVGFGSTPGICKGEAAALGE